MHHDDEEENVPTYKIHGSLEILAIKNTNLEETDDDLEELLDELREEIGDESCLDVSFSSSEGVLFWGTGSSTPSSLLLPEDGVLFWGTGSSTPSSLLLLEASRLLVADFPFSLDVFEDSGFLTEGNGSSIPEKVIESFRNVLVLMKTD